MTRIQRLRRSAAAATPHRREYCEKPNKEAKNQRDEEGRAEDRAQKLRRSQVSFRPEDEMLYTIAVVLLVLWLLGLVTSYTLGGFIHALLVLAVIVLVFQLLTGRRAP